MRRPITYFAKTWAYNLIQRGRNSDLTPKDIVKFYNDIFKDYEKAITYVGYRAHIETANALAGLYPSKREKIKILDVAAGTGLVAFELSKRGFKTMDALDASEAMLKEAQKTKLYGRCICANVDGSKLDIEDDTYDAVTISAGFGLIMKDTQKGMAGMRELIRLVKPGGTFVNTNRQCYFSVGEEAKTEHDILLETLEKEGKWKLERKMMFEQYMKYLGKCEGGIVVIHRVCV